MAGHSPAGARNLGVGFGGGTPGGRSSRAGAPSIVPHGDAAYLWALVFIELLVTGWLRVSFKRYHGG